MSESDTVGTREIVTAALKEKEQRLMGELAPILEELEKVRKALAEILAGEAPHASLFRHSQARNLGSELRMRDDPPRIQDDNPFRGMGLAQAAVSYLRTCNRQPQTVRQIWNALERTGFKVAAEKPEATLSWQLRKRDTKLGDVFLIGNGLWALADWYPSTIVLLCRQHRNVASGRNHGEHVERTTKGIQAAKQRGVNWGRPPKITAELMAIVKGALAEGKSDREAGALVGLSYATIHMLRKSGAIDKWEIGMPWPPPEAKNYGTQRVKDANGHDTEDADDARPSN
jgi:hypothetical protein